MAQRSLLQTDLAAELLPALWHWRAAILGLRDNPLYVLLTRASARRRQAGAADSRRNLLQLGLVIASLFGLCYFLLPSLVLIPFELRLPLAIVISLLGLVSLWVSMGLYDTAIFALRLLGIPGTLGSGQLNLDETMLTAQLDEREIVSGLVAACLPRLWLRWSVGAPAALLLYLLLALIFNRIEHGGSSVLLDTLPSGIDVWMLLRFSPLSLLFLYLLGLLGSILLLLFLIALGRSIAQYWQAQLVASSLTLVQLLFVPMGFFAFFNWYDSYSPQASYLVVIGGALAPFFPLAWFSAVMHFARPRPLLRIFLAALPPPAGLLAWWLILLNLGAGFREIALRDFVCSIGWYFSSGALLNVLGLPLSGCFGLEPQHSVPYQSLEWFRLPLLLAMTFALIGICATAARHAVFDWRHAED